MWPFNRKKQAITPPTARNLARQRELEAQFWPQYSEVAGNSRSPLQEVRAKKERGGQTRKNPYKSYCTLIRNFRNCTGTEHVPFGESEIYRQLARSTDEVKQLFIHWTGAHGGFYTLNRHSRDSLALNTLCEQGPDPVLFQSIWAYLNQL